MQGRPYILSNNLEVLFLFYINNITIPSSAAFCIGLWMSKMTIIWLSHRLVPNPSNGIVSRTQTTDKLFTYFYMYSYGGRCFCSGDVVGILRVPPLSISTCGNTQWGHLAGLS